MRILGIALLPLLALPVIAHDMQPRAVANAIGRHTELEYKRQNGGVLGGILGGADDDAPSSVVLVPGSSTHSSSSTASAASTTAPPSSVASTTAPPTSSGSASGSLSGLPSSLSTPSGSLSANSSSTASASNSSTSAPPSSSAAQSMSTSVDAQGSTIIITKYATASASATSGTADASTSSNPPTENAPGISTGAIIGISVAAGVVVLSLIGCAIWRMKRRNGDEDEAIRWPELNRHGDSDAHHALPARQTGQHGIETSPLERSLSNSSSVYHSSLARGPSTHMASTAMPLNGSNFGAANSLDYYDEKAYAGHSQGGYEAYDNYPLSNGHSAPEDAYGGAAMAEDYSSMPPPMQHAHSSHGARAPGYSSDEEEIGGGAAGYPARHAYGH